MAITQYSELDAVNLILRNMGETSINSLENPPLDASEARETLKEVSRHVQARGWYFNSEIMPLSPDNNGKIALPPNTMSVSAVGSSRHMKVSKRGGFLYRLDPFNSGFVFDGPVAVQLVLGLDFDDLPPCASNYIALRAARVMQTRQVGDAMSANEDNEEEKLAFAELHAEQLATERLSLTNSYGVRTRLGQTYLRIL